MESNKPEIVFKFGNIQAAVWKNQAAKGSFYSVTLERIYKKDDVWAYTSQLRKNDLPKAIFALNKAYEYLLTNKSEQEE